MNLLFTNIFFVGFIVSEIPRVSTFGYFPLWQKILLAFGNCTMELSTSRAKNREEQELTFMK